MHFVNSFGETLIIRCPATGIFGIIKYVSTLKYRWFVFAFVGFCSDHPDHQTVGLTSSLFLAVTLVLTSLIQPLTQKQIFVGLLALLLEVLLTTYYWLPALQLSQYIQQANNHTMFLPNFRFLLHTVEIWLAASRIIWWGGLDLGLPAMDCDCAFSFLLFKIKSQNRSLAPFFFSSFCVLFILMQSVTKPFWQLPLVNNFRLSRCCCWSRHFCVGTGSNHGQEYFCSCDWNVWLKSGIRKADQTTTIHKKIRSNLFGLVSAVWPWQPLS